MLINIRQIHGNWNLGYVLDKHTLRSTYLGDNPDTGRAMFDTQRSEVGEALYRLKYQGDWSQVAPLAQQLVTSVCPMFGSIGLVVPMPASKHRARQPVLEIAREVTKALGQANLLTFENLLVKSAAGAQLKDLSGKQEKLDALKGKFSINDTIAGDGKYDALLIDDLFDTGASVEAACAALRTYEKIRNIYVAVLTWK